MPITGGYNTANGSSIQVTDPTDATSLPNSVILNKALGKLYAAIATSGGLQVKASVKVYADSDITLSGLQIIDNYQLIVGDRVIVGNKTDNTKQGVYVAASGTWTRATDSDTALKLHYAYYYVEQGTVYGSLGYVCTIAEDAVLGNDEVPFVKFTSTKNDIGIYLSGVTYKINDLVIYNGYIWQCIVNGTKNILPTDTSVKWIRITNELGSYAVTTINSNYTVTKSDYIIMVDASTNPGIIITLPATSDASISSTINKQYKIIKVDSSANVIQVNTNSEPPGVGTDTFLNGSTTYLIKKQGVFHNLIAYRSLGKYITDQSNVWFYRPLVIDSNQTLTTDNYYLCNFSAARILTLPASPLVGDRVTFSDIANNFATYNLTVARNGNKIESVNNDYIANINGQKLLFIYVSTSIGWKVIENTYTKLITSSVKTTNFTAAAGNIYPVNLSAAATVTLPLTANLYDNAEIVIYDKIGNFATYNLTINPNTSQTINGQSTLILTNNYQRVSLRFSLSEQNWVATVATSPWYGTPIYLSGTPSNDLSSNNYYLAQYASAQTITLPANPSNGDKIAIKDAGMGFNTNNLTIGRNSKNINGSASNLTLNTDDTYIELVYQTSATNWVITQQTPSAKFKLASTQTTSFTASPNYIYPINLSAAATLTLPANSKCTTGTQILIYDTASNFNVYNLTISPNTSQTINMSSNNLVLTKANQSILLTYSNGNWVADYNGAGILNLPISLVNSTSTVTALNQEYFIDNSAGTSINLTLPVISTAQAGSVVGVRLSTNITSLTNNAVFQVTSSAGISGIGNTSDSSADALPTTMYIRSINNYTYYFKVAYTTSAKSAVCYQLINPPRPASNSASSVTTISGSTTYYLRPGFAYTISPGATVSNAVTLTPVAGNVGDRISVVIDQYLAKSNLCAFSGLQGTNNTLLNMDSVAYELIYNNTGWAVNKPAGSYAYARFSIGANQTTGIAVTNPLKFSATPEVIVGTGITSDGAGAITLAAGRLYRVKVTIPGANNSGSAGQLTVQWNNVTAANTDFGPAYAAVGAATGAFNPEGGDGSAILDLRNGVSTVIKCLIKFINNINAIGVTSNVDGFTTTNAYAFCEIETK